MARRKCNHGILAIIRLVGPERRGSGRRKETRVTHLRYQDGIPRRPMAAGTIPQRSCPARECSQSPPALENLCPSRRRSPSQAPRRSTEQAGPKCRHLPRPLIPGAIPLPANGREGWTVFVGRLCCVSTWFGRAGIGLVGVGRCASVGVDLALPCVETPGQHRRPRFREVWSRAPTMYSREDGATRRRSAICSRQSVGRWLQLDGVKGARPGSMLGQPLPP